MQKKNLTLFVKKIFKQRISPEDTRTVQAHKGAGGDLDYYISSPYLQDGSNYLSVQTIIEDIENQRYIYKGMLGGANNAVGIIESNVPLSEIVANPDGNTKLLEMISEENALKLCNQYYRKIGEPEEPLKGHSTYFGKPEFILGTITRNKRGKFSYSSNIRQDIEEMLQKEREENIRKESMRVQDNVEIDLGGGMVVARQDCWLERGKKIMFAGVNNEALFWEYSPNNPIPIENGKYYIQIGTLQIGERTIKRTENDEPLKFISPYIYDNVVLCTEGKKLIQYFLNNKYDGLNLALGEIFSTHNLEESKKTSYKLATDSKKSILVGGITLDENASVKKIDDIPETVIEELARFSKEHKQEITTDIYFEK